MKQYYLTASLLLFLSTLLTACDKGNTETSTQNSASPVQAASAAELLTGTVQAAASNSADAIELDWDALIPSDWRLDKLMDEYNADNLSDDDPRAKELMEKLKTFWRESPVVHDYDGKNVKLPGFVVPLEMDAKTIQEFLLVPYYGACIHTPPPPANQTVYVVTEKDKAYQGKLFDTVWVTGKITVDKLSSELGDAGYRIDATKVEPYQ